MPVGSWTLEFGCSVIADPNRTSAYVANSQDPAYCENGVNVMAPAKPSWQHINLSCSCPALQWEAPSPGATPVPIPPYTTPADDLAPWFSQLVEESRYFYGFIIEKVEDLSTNTVTRSITNRATRYGGGTLGSLRRLPRKIKFTLLAFGNSDCALDYGFRWLADTLTYTCNDDCTLCDATVRTCCPDIDPQNPTYTDWDTGRWSFKNVGIIDGPRYEEPPVPANECNMRRVSFTIASESPYAYKCPVPCMENEIIATALPACPPVNWICSNNRAEICCRTESQYSIGDDGIIVTINAQEDLYNLEIKITPDTFGYECNPETAPPGYERLAPCATLLIPFLPNGYVLNYDTSDEILTVTLPGGTVRDGTPYVDASTGEPPTFPTLRCGSYCICISIDRCGFSGGNSTASISSVHREQAI